MARRSLKQWRAKDRQLRKTYGITLEQWWEMLEKQGVACYICRRKFKVTGRAGPRTPQVDHCHITGRVRGLLCRTCNYRILPYFEGYEYRIDNLRNYLIGNTSCD